MLTNCNFIFLILLIFLHNFLLLITVAKVRRLYDIANILTSIKFLEKTTSYENATKKAAYKWVGIDLKSLDSEEGRYLDTLCGNSLGRLEVLFC